MPTVKIPGSYSGEGQSNRCLPKKFSNLHGHLTAFQARRVRSLEQKENEIKQKRRLCEPEAKV